MEGGREGGEREKERERERERERDGWTDGWLDDGWSKQSATHYLANCIFHPMLSSARTHTHTHHPTVSSLLALYLLTSRDVSRQRHFVDEEKFVYLHSHLR